MCSRCRGLRPLRCARRAGRPAARLCRLLEKSGTRLRSLQTAPSPLPYQRRVQNQRLPTGEYPIRTSHFAPNPASRKTLALSRPGGHRGVPPPVPIPNTAVKRPSAYGTSSQDAGESVAARSAKRKSSNRLITNPQTNPIPRGGAAR